MHVIVAFKIMNNLIICHNIISFRPGVCPSHDIVLIKSDQFLHGEVT